MRENLYEYCVRSGNCTLLDQWDAERNVDLTPLTVSYGSKKKVWWKCSKGHDWQASVVSRTVRGSGCPVCAGLRVLAGENDLQTMYPAVASEWHPDKNEGLNPWEVRPGSHRKVWWRCAFGHGWQATIKSRCEDNHCPVCSGKTVMPGENDLATEYPALAAEWHDAKNGTLTPQDVRAGSHRKVWWRCAKGHEWQAVISSRSLDGCGCPVCAGKQIISGVNDLETQYPAVAARWHPDRNETLTPNVVSPFSNRKVWWICEQGHEWNAAIKDCTFKQAGCPYCKGRKVLPGFNDLETVYPEIAAQWYQPMNGTLTPRDVTAGSARKVWWICSDGHVWKAVIYSRTGAKKHGCPVCAVDRGKKRKKASVNVRSRTKDADSKKLPAPEFVKK